MPPKKAKKSTAVANKPSKNKPAKTGGKIPKANKTKTKNAKRKIANKKRQTKRTQKRRKEKKKTAKKKRKATKTKKKRTKDAKKTKKKKEGDKKKDLQKKEQQPNSDEEAGGIGKPKFKFKFAGLSLFQMRDLRADLKIMNKEDFLEQLRNFTEERSKDKKILDAFNGSPEERIKLFTDQEKPTDSSAGPFQSNRYGAIFLLPGE